MTTVTDPAAPKPLRVNSSATGANTIGFIGRNDEDFKTPVVYYAPGVKEQIDYIIKKCADEVGWLGLVEKHPEKMEFTITEIFVPEQEVHGSETDISAETMGKLAHQLIEQDKDVGQLYYWGHSHVNMGVSPSAQDEQQVAEYLEHCRWFIRGIYNKAGLNKVDVYDAQRGIVFQCVTNEKKNLGLSDEVVATLDTNLAANVKKAPPIVQTTQYGGYAGGVTGRNVGKQPTLNRGAAIYVIGQNAEEVAEYLRKTA